MARSNTQQQPKSIPPVAVIECRGWRWQDGGEVKEFAWGQQRDAFQTTQAFLDAGIVAWGVKNDYPETLLEAIIAAPTARKVMANTATMVAGAGWETKSIDGNTAREKEAKSRLEAIGFSRAFIKQVAIDLSRFQGFCVQIARNNGNLYSLAYTALYRMRVGMPKDLDPETPASMFALSADWRRLDSALQPKKAEYIAATPTWLPKFEPGGTANLSLYYDFERDPYSDYYPIPEVESVRDSMTVESNTNAFQANYTKNGMVASGHVAIPFVPSFPPKDGALDPRDETELSRKLNQFKKEVTGVRAAGQLLVTVYNPNMVDKNGNPAGSVRIDPPIQESNEKKFLELQTHARQSLFTALGVVSTDLYGLSAATGFSSQAEMLHTAFAITDALNIQPKRQILLDFGNAMLAELGYPDCELVIENVVPVPTKHGVEYVDAGILTPNEVRGELGFAEILEDEQPGGNPAQEALKNTVGADNAIAAMLEKVNAGLITAKQARAFLALRYGYSETDPLILVMFPDPVAAVPPTEPTPQFRRK